MSGIKCSCIVQSLLDYYCPKDCKCQSMMDLEMLHIMKWKFCAIVYFIENPPTTYLKSHGYWIYQITMLIQITDKLSPSPDSVFKKAFPNILGIPLSNFLKL